MESKFRSSQLMSDQEEDGNTTESGPESPSSSLLNDIKMTPKRSKRGMQKRVVRVPIKDMEGSRFKGENTNPPSDSWAWRKYGQKPIKGSPYPRGYYRCSSFKGCPARKQVERSKVEPSMVVVTYSSEHNHPCPLPNRNRQYYQQQPNTSAKPNPNNPMIPKICVTTTTYCEKLESKSENESEPEVEKPTDMGPEESTLLLTTSEEFGWFGDLGTTNSTIFESPMFSEDIGRGNGQSDVSVIFTMREEDESLFADLGELPECTAVFRQQCGVGPQVQIC